MNFFTSNHCASRSHCTTCRSRDRGAKWRAAIAKTFGLEGESFDCPHGVPWNSKAVEIAYIRASRPEIKDEFEKTVALACAFDGDEATRRWLRSMAAQCQELYQRRFPSCGQARKHRAHQLAKLRYFYREAVAHKEATMKTIAAALMLSAYLAQAEPPTAITAYYTNAVLVEGSATNAGDTGLATGTVYLAFSVSEIANTEYTAGLMTNDVRPMIARLVDYLQERIAAQDSTNQFSTYTVTERTMTYSGVTNRTVFRGINEQQNISITPTYGSN